MGALSLALMTGCGSSDEGSKDSGDSKGSSSAAASDAKALTSAELEKLLLAQGEVKGYKVGSGDDTAATSKSAVKVDKSECAPMAWATNGLPPGDTDANATNSLTEDKASDAPTSLDDVSEADIEGAFDITMTYVGLSSYEGDGDGAEKTIKSLSDGVSACAGGYGFTADGESSKVTKVATEKGSGQGDESVAFTQDVEVEGQTVTAHTEVVRKGNTLATFFTMDLAALAKGGEMSDVPAAVIDAQVAKLK
ncbi:lipoprotein [Streptomyces phaeofaciens JCM 4814]|uniref:Lipoprotein n=2 Tax=Streptomyces phaeofaciens TaxID=68254 RepID=A0A918LQA8_9ACTN|nr:lipoprotein [Streptomyces phaeofaciens]